MALESGHSMMENETIFVTSILYDCDCDGPIE